MPRRYVCQRPHYRLKSVSWNELFERTDSQKARAAVWARWLSKPLLIGCSSHLARHCWVNLSMIGCLPPPLILPSSRVAALFRHRPRWPLCGLGSRLSTFWNTTEPSLQGRRSWARVKMASPKTVPKDAQVNNEPVTVLSLCFAPFIVIKVLKQHD